MKLFIPIFLIIPIMSSCSGGGGGSSGGSSTTGSGISDISKGGNCNTSDGFYQDSGYVSGLKLNPGQMPSDISESGIPACNKGQFVFNGSCYNNLSFSDSSGLFSITGNGATNNILGPNLQIPSLLKSYCQNLNSYRNACDQNVGINSSSLTLVWLSHYTSFIKRDSYSNNALMDWTMKNTSNGFIVNGNATVKFRSNYGTCLNNGNPYNVYDWYYNGSINLNGNNYNLPLSYNTFASVYPNTIKIKCPEINTGLLTCYKIDTNWVSEEFHFDEKSNLNIISVNYK